VVGWLLLCRWYCSHSSLDPWDDEEDEDDDELEWADALLVLTPSSAALMMLFVSDSKSP
jgi:hypothetical protein